MFMTPYFAFLNFILKYIFFICILENGITISLLVLITENVCLVSVCDGVCVIRVLCSVQTNVTIIEQTTKRQDKQVLIGPN